MSTTSIYTTTKQHFQSRNAMIPSPKLRKVKRVLFGPIEPQATQKFLDDELKKIIDINSEKWNFDFKTETPLKTNGDGFQWRIATPQKHIRPIHNSHYNNKRNDIGYDNINEYCPITIENNDCIKNELIRPIPIKPTTTTPTNNNNNNNNNCHPKEQHQTRITDYLKAKKRQASSTVDLSKKQSSSDWDPDIPNKMPRLDIVI